MEDITCQIIETNQSRLLKYLYQKQAVNAKVEKELGKRALRIITSLLFPVKVLAYGGKLQG